MFFKVALSFYQDNFRNTSHQEELLIKAWANNKYDSLYRIHHIELFYHHLYRYCKSNISTNLNQFSVYYPHSNLFLLLFRIQISGLDNIK